MTVVKPFILLMITLFFSSKVYSQNNIQWKTAVYAEQTWSCHAGNTPPETDWNKASFYRAHLQLTPGWPIFN